MTEHPVDPLPFSLEWLAEASRTKRPLTVCAGGHLVVRGNTHWAPQRFSADLKSLICQPVEHHDADPNGAG